MGRGRGRVGVRVTVRSVPAGQSQRLVAPVMGHERGVYVGGVLGFRVYVGGVLGFRVYVGGVLGFRVNVSGVLGFGEFRYRVWGV